MNSPALQQKNNPEASLPGATVERPAESRQHSALDVVRNNNKKLKLNSSGSAVTEMQSDLLEAAKKLGIETNLENSKEFKQAKFGRKTYELLCEIQGKLRLDKGDGSTAPVIQDGILGPRTQRAIDVLLGRAVSAVSDFQIVIGNDWTGYDRSESRARAFYQNENLEFNPQSYNPYFSEDSEFGKKNIRVNQTQGWNCGPTSSAMAVAPLLGVHPSQLADLFTGIQRRKQGASGMGWTRPMDFARAVGLNCQELGVASPEELFARIQRGERIIVSVNNNRLGRNAGLKQDRLTGGGHIICLGNATRDEHGKLVFENVDPNGKNIQKGFGFLTEDELRIAMRGKNSWSFTK